MNYQSEQGLSVLIIERAIWSLKTGREKYACLALMEATNFYDVWPQRKFYVSAFEAFLISQDPQAKLPTWWQKAAMSDRDMVEKIMFLTAWVKVIKDRMEHLRLQRQKEQYMLHDLSETIRELTQ